jgi:tetratricopeptide (TPR) repeat protein
MGTRQYDEALQQLYAYLENVHLYTTARRFEGAIWRSIGVGHQRKLESKLAIDALNRAQIWFAKQGADHSAFSCIHDLIHTYLQVNETDPKFSLKPVGDLLVKERELARKYPEDPFFRGIYLYDQASRYLRIKRYPRAMVCAMQALDISKDDHQLTSNAHMILYECCRDLGDTKQALGYALAARVSAIQGRHFELEFLAAQAMAEIIRKQGTEVIRELDLEYQAMGVDLSQYLSPEILRRVN